MHYQHITGLTYSQFDELLTRVRDGVDGESSVRSFMLSIEETLIVTLAYFKTNMTQAAIGEVVGVSQPTVSRIISSMERTVEKALADCVMDEEVLADTSAKTALVTDGTLMPCWSWKSNPELYSGKHHTTGHNHQVIATLEGHLCYISDPLPGSTHDITAMRTHHLDDLLDVANTVADKGYIGSGMITPLKKPQSRDLDDAEKNRNAGINKIRYVIEQVIANIKTWRLFHTDYRRPLKTYAQAFKTYRALCFFTRARE